MSKLIVVLETSVQYEPIVSIQNLLSIIQGKQELPEGVEVISNTAFLVEFPKCALFFAKLLVALDKEHCKYQFFELSETKDQS